MTEKEHKSKRNLFDANNFSVSEELLKEMEDGEAFCPERQVESMTVFQDEGTKECLHCEKRVRGRRTRKIQRQEIYN